MYFIKSPKKIKLDTFFLHLLPALAVLAAMLILTLILWRNASTSLDDEQDVATANLAQGAEKRLSEQLATYETILVGVSGLFSSSEFVTREEWEVFLSNYKLRDNYSAIELVGFSRLVTADETPQFTRQIRERLSTDFKIFPTTDLDMHVVNIYSEPFNKELIGFDHLSHPVRREAIMQSGESGRASMSGKHDFISRLNSNETSGMTMFLPVFSYTYNSDSKITKNRLIGFTHAPVITDQLFDDIFRSGHGSSPEVKIYDGERSEDRVIYKSDNFNDDGNTSMYTYSSQWSIYDQSWMVDFQFPTDIVPETTRTRPINTLVGGLIISPFLATFVFMLLASRTRSLNQAKQTEVNDAKDELLSLASHQLRTPATSVKQYIGMIKEGFAGELNPQQAAMIEKAYESNERQLHIINELLYVAKIDAKGIVLTPRKINLNQLIKEVAQELGVTAKKRTQKIRVYLPKKKVTIEADEHCVRMAVENLISNALKYSPDDTTTTVRLTNFKDHVEISVKDRGIGISADDIHLLFQRFSRIPNAYSKQISGSGIGLYLSQQLINLHGGSIDVESTKDKGTTFTIHLPKDYIS